jgi:molecular chaperone DnaK (HSP70)
MELVAASRSSVCFDFGTAYSKAARSPVGGSGGSSAIPLPIGRSANSLDTFIVPSLVFVEGDRIFLGPAAFDRLAECGQPGREALTSFKILLASADLEAVLMTLPSPRVEPARRLIHRHLVVLFLAYLISLADDALAGARLGGISCFHSRFVLPDWTRRANERRLGLISELFEQAFLLADVLGKNLISGSVDRIVLERGLSAISGGSIRNRIEGAIFEPAAAAFAFLPSILADRATSIVVVDVGAGTTDFAGFRVSSNRGSRLVFLPETCRSADVAGDAFDAAVLNMIVEDDRIKLGLEERDALWRSLSRNIRALKTTIVSTGFLELTIGSRTLMFSLKALEASPELNRSMAILSDHLDQVVSLIGRRSNASKERIGLIITGGGANFPFIQKMTQRRPGQTKRAPLTRIAPPADRYVSLSEPVLNQLTTVLGGAAADRETMRALKKETFT